MKIVVVGDCVATGQDVLLPEITGNKDILSDGVDFKRNGKKQLVSWFLKNKKGKVSTDELLSASYQEKIKQEKLLAWPSYIKGCQNLAVAGETFQGIHKKIKTLIDNGSVLDLVIITDFSDSHRCVVINHQNTKYVVKRDINFLDLEQNIWPESVYKIFVQKVLAQERNGEKYQRRKNKKSFDMLCKLLHKHKIPFHFCVFREQNKFFSSTYKDFCALAKSYSNPLGQDKCSEKLVRQRHIAEVISSELSL